MTDQTKLREAVARAIDPEAYYNDEYAQIKARRRVYAEAAADRILSLPEIADALKREEQGIGLIAAERERQISQEGWTPEHDDAHIDQSLPFNAALLLSSGADFEVDELRGDCRLERIDWGLAVKHKGNRIRQLTIAAALIAGEIDRLNRAAMSGGEKFDGKDRK